MSTTPTPPPKTEQPTWNDVDIFVAAEPVGRELAMVLFNRTDRPIDLQPRDAAGKTGAEFRVFFEEYIAWPKVRAIKVRTGGWTVDFDDAEKCLILRVTGKTEIPSLLFLAVEFSDVEMDQIHFNPTLTVAASGVAGLGSLPTRQVTAKVRLNQELLPRLPLRATLRPGIIELGDRTSTVEVVLTLEDEQPWFHCSRVAGRRATYFPAGIQLAVGVLAEAGAKPEDAVLDTKELAIACGGGCAKTWRQRPKASQADKAACVVESIESSANPVFHPAEGASLVLSLNGLRIRRAGLVDVVVSYGGGGGYGRTEFVLPLLVTERRRKPRMPFSATLNTRQVVVDGTPQDILLTLADETDEKWPNAADKRLALPTRLKGRVYAAGYGSAAEGFDESKTALEFLLLDGGLKSKITKNETAAGSKRYTYEFEITGTKYFVPGDAPLFHLKLKQITPLAEGDVFIIVELDEDTEFRKSRFALELRRAVDNSAPYGTIVMWYGDPTSSLPKGWALCNGQNGTPDLRGRFVAGAVAAGEEVVRNEKDAKDYQARFSFVPQPAQPAKIPDTRTDMRDRIYHNHHLDLTENKTKPDGAHTHLSNGEWTVRWYKAGNDHQGVDPMINAHPRGTSEVINRYHGGNHAITTNGGGHTHTFDVKGESKWEATLPPYFVLCYIMKTTGKKYWTPKTT